MVTVWPTCSASLTVPLRSSQVLPFSPVIANSSAESPFCRQPVTVISECLGLAVFAGAALSCAWNATGQRLMNKAATNQNESFAILWNIWSSSSVLFFDLLLVEFPNCYEHSDVQISSYIRVTSEDFACSHQPTNS